MTLYDWVRLLPSTLLCRLALVTGEHTQHTRYNVQGIDLGGMDRSQYFGFSKDL